MLLPSTTTGCLLLPNKTPRTTGRLNLQGWTFGVKPEYALGLTDPPSRLSKLFPFLLPGLANPKRPIALRFSVIDESCPLSADVDSDDEAAAHKGSPCLGRALTPTARRSASGSCEWTLEAPVNITITKAAALRSSPRCSSLSPLAGLVLVIEAFGCTSPNKDNKGKRALLATGRLHLTEQVNAQRHRPPASVLIVPLQPAGRAASTTDAAMELGLSLSCQPPAARTQPPLALADKAWEQQPPEPTVEDEKEEVVVAAPMTKTQPGEQEEQQHKQEEVELKQELKQEPHPVDPKPEPKLEAEPELGSIVVMVRAPSQPLRRSSLPPLPPPTPARVEALRQWEQWQREHQQHQQQKQQHQQHQQQRAQSKGLRSTPRTTSCAPTGAGQEDAAVRRAQLARVRSLLDELESLPESLAEIRAAATASSSSSSTACKAPPPRPEVQPEAVVPPPTRRPGKTRAGMM